MCMYPSIPYLNGSNTIESWKNFTYYYLLTIRIVVNVIVWEKGRGKQAAGQHSLRVESCGRNVYSVILFN